MAEWAKANGHIDLNYLPPTVFEGQGPPDLRHRIPRVVERDGGKRWMAGDPDIAPVGAVGFLGQLDGKDLSRHVDAMAAAGFFEDMKRGVLHPTAADLRGRAGHLSSGGQDREVVIPNL
jgi:hypothetical protein